MAGGPGLPTNTFPGADGLVEAWRDWLASFETVSLQLRDVISDGEDHLVAKALQTGKSKTAGVPVEQESAVVWGIRDGQIIWVEFHLDPDAALRAARLERS